MRNIVDGLSSIDMRMCEMNLILREINESLKAIAEKLPKAVESSGTIQIFTK